MYNVERKALIMKKLEENGSMSVAELAEILHISKETVRRDLRELENDSMISRTHGGALFVQQPNSVTEHPFNVREVQHYSEKAAICKCAAQYIQDGDTIFVDSSSTCSSLLKNINPNYQITVITDSVRQLLEVAALNNDNFLTICLGGIFRTKNQSLYGDLSLNSVRYFRPTKTFIACRSVEPVGLSDGSIYGVDIKRAIINASKEVIVLADYSKFTERGPVFMVGLDSVTRVITDDKVREEDVRMLEMAGVECVIAP